jgi:hypothetical protein
MMRLNSKKVCDAAPLKLGFLITESTPVELQQQNILDIEQNYVSIAGIFPNLIFAKLQFAHRRKLTSYYSCKRQIYAVKI